ncbi:MAG: hypothetical protein M3008_08945 [Chloroflexota bacterium]|nr:hypothetical protein [Chloroflexota bacterium]
MQDEVFRQALGVTNAERLLIDQMWADVLRQNQWRRRGWRLLHRLRVFPFFLREGSWGARNMRTRRR